MPAKKNESNLALSMELLWGNPKKTGWSGLSPQSIIADAVALADAGGLSAVSMRRIADRLGAGTMSLYAHVPGKADLVGLMVDAVLNRLYSDVQEPSRQGGWRQGVRFVAAANWAVFGRHPWLLETSGSRPLLGPSLCLKYEAELGPLDGIGLSDLEMDSVLTLVLTHVEGTARGLAAQKKQAAEGSDGDWWAEVGPLLEKWMDGSQYPLSGRVGQAAGEAHQGPGDPSYAYSFGLDRILDSVELLIRGR